MHRGTGHRHISDDGERGGPEIACFSLRLRVRPSRDQHYGGYGRGDTEQFRGEQRIQRSQVRRYEE